VGFALVPLGLALFVAVIMAALFRGGPSMMLAGIAIVREDGRRAFRLQCALRAVLVWLPVLSLLFVSALLQTAAPRQVYLAAGLWLVAAGLLPVYAIIALRFSSRPPQDQILGTYLVPV
jgi:eukaryotic-like serine/threonine-protein kinase